MISAAGDFCEFVHDFLDDRWRCQIILIRCFFSLEENVRVLGSAANDRIFRIQSAIAVRINEIVIDDFLHVSLCQLFDLADFMRSAEAIKEMQERNACLECGRVCDHCHVLSFLNGIGCDQRETGLASRHDVAVVAEN